ncbi:MAG: hypothetical protein U0183_14600 [Polyangiaceae bacterium]
MLIPDFVAEHTRLLLVETGEPECPPRAEDFPITSLEPLSGDWIASFPKPAVTFCRYTWMVEVPDVDLPLFVSPRHVAPDGRGVDMGAGDDGAGTPGSDGFGAGWTCDGSSPRAAPLHRLSGAGTRTH